jgi:hypothetical protein
MMGSLMEKKKSAEVPCVIALHELNINRVDINAYAVNGVIHMHVIWINCPFQTQSASCPKLTKNSSVMPNPLY